MVAGLRGRDPGSRLSAELEVDEGQIYSKGSKDVLERAVLAGRATGESDSQICMSDGAPGRIKLRTHMSFKSRYNSKRCWAGRCPLPVGGALGTVGAQVVDAIGDLARDGDVVFSMLPDYAALVAVT